MLPEFVSIDIESGKMIQLFRRMRTWLGVQQTSQLKHANKHVLKTGENAKFLPLTDGVWNKAQQIMQGQKDDSFLPMPPHWQVESLESAVLIVAVDIGRFGYRIYELCETTIDHSDRENLTHAFAFDVAVLAQILSNVNSEGADLKIHDLLPEFINSSLMLLADDVKVAVSQRAFNLSLILNGDGEEAQKFRRLLGRVVTGYCMGSTALPEITGHDYPAIIRSLADWSNRLTQASVVSEPKGR